MSVELKKLTSVAEWEASCMPEGARELIDFSRADAAYHHVALSDKG